MQQEHLAALFVVGALMLGAYAQVWRGQAIKRTAAREGLFILAAPFRKLE